MPEVRFCYISIKRMIRIGPKFVYALILTRSRLELLPVIFYVRMLFTLHILKTNGRNSNTFCVFINIDKIRTGIDMHVFAAWLWPLNNVLLDFYAGLAFSHTVRTALGL